MGMSDFYGVGEEAESIATIHRAIEFAVAHALPTRQQKARVKKTRASAFRLMQPIQTQ
jgi:hypothetical protein